jgi:hypothetical protein
MNARPDPLDLQERILEQSIASAIRELQESPEAVALAEIAAVARKHGAALARSNEAPWIASIDAHITCRGALDDLAFDACVANGLDRSALPGTGVLIDILTAEKPQPITRGELAQRHALRGREADARREKVGSCPSRWCNFGCVTGPHRSGGFGCNL